VPEAAPGPRRTVFEVDRVIMSYRRLTIEAYPKSESDIAGWEELARALRATLQGKDHLVESPRIEEEVRDW